MAKTNSLKSKGVKPMSFEKAIKLAIETPRLTRKQIDELKRTGKLEQLLNRTK